MKVLKQPLKSGGVFVTDSNFKVRLFTEKQALSHTRKFKRTLERGFINGYKFKNCTVSDRGGYWSQSLS